MSQQQSSKNQKQRRNRTNSEGHNQNQRRGGGQGHGGGGGGFAKVFTNSNSTAGTRELQSLLNTLPNSTSTASPRTPQTQQQQQQSGLGYQGQGQVGQSQGSASARRRGNSYSNSNYNNGTSGGGGGSGAQGQNLDNRDDFDMANNEDAESIRLNSSALRRIDKDFAKLHGTASQVAVYRYNPATKSWDKTDTVGCLFLYERSIGPRYGLVVMNRKNANNFIQCFGSDGQVVLQTPYLLLKSGEDVGDGTQVINCIWFYDIQDCYSSAIILKQMGLKFEGEMGGGVDAAQAQGGMGGGSANPGGGGGGGGGTSMVGAGNALFQMLQPKDSPTPKMKGGVMTAEELESQMLDEAPVPVVAAATPASSASASVFQQFVNLSVKGNGQVEMAPTTTSTSESNLSPLTISQNKMRTVEQLERQMKQRRPPPAVAVAPTNNFNDPTAAIQNELIQTLGITNSITKSSGSPSLSHATLPPIMAQNSELGGQKSKVTLLANVIGKCVDDVDPEDLRKLLEVMDPSDLVLVTVPGPAGEGGEPKLNWKMRQRPYSQGQNTNGGSTTSSFTTPTGEFLSASGTRSNSQLGSGQGHAPPQRPAVLAKEQMQKALIHLIQTDDGFLTQIHDAYVRTLELRYQQQHQQPY